MRDEETLVMVLAVISIGAFVTVFSVYQARRHAYRKQRLEVVQKALEHASVDDHTRTELLRVLTEEHRRDSRTFAERTGGLWNIGKILLLGVGWITFLGAGCALLVIRFGHLSWMKSEPWWVLLIIGFIAMSLPSAMRELMGRSNRTAPVRP